MVPQKRGSVHKHMHDVSKEMELKLQKVETKRKILYLIILPIGSLADWTEQGLTNKLGYHSLVLPYIHPEKPPLESNLTLIHFPSSVLVSHIISVKRWVF